MEGSPLKADGYPIFVHLPCAELPKVLSRLGHSVSKELHLDPAHVLPSDGYVEKDNGVVLLLARVHHPLQSQCKVKELGKGGARGVLQLRRKRHFT